MSKLRAKQRLEYKFTEAAELPKLVLRQAGKEAAQ